MLRMLIVKLLYLLPAFLATWSISSLAQEHGSASARILLQSTLAAGLRHHDAKAVWNDLRVGDSVVLVRDAANPFDSNAVRIDWKDKTLGYLPRTENALVARQLDRGNPLTARITTLSLYRNHRRKLGIEIFAPL